MDEIRLPLTVANTNWVFCHIFGEKIEPEFVDLSIESVYEDEVDEESVNKPIESLDFIKRYENVLLHEL